jgi:hypothetical protein
VKPVAQNESDGSNPVGDRQGPFRATEKNRPGERLMGRAKCENPRFQLGLLELGWGLKQYITEWHSGGRRFDPVQPNQ